MLIILLACSLFQSYYADAGQGPASIELRAVSTCGDQNSCRSIWNIVLSCLSTIFLCTWVSVHPNIAFRPEKPDAGWRERWIWDPLHDFWSYKLPLFMWALLVPEYILSWSIRQFVAAGQIQKKVPGWTRTHGFFMVMGGFHLFRLPAGTPSVPMVNISYEPSDFVTPSGYFSRKREVPVCPLQIDDIPAGILQLFYPTEAELKDRGKSDSLTKLIVLFQTLWFIIQCIARGIRHLPLTELEVVTLAYTMLNFFIYIFWWNKPQNVGCPIRLYKTSTAEHRKGGKEVEPWDAGGVKGLFRNTYTYIVGAQDRHVDYSHESSLPMFWSGWPGIAAGTASSSGMSLVAAGFGGIHFIAWYSEFPSRAELILWRVGCVLFTAVPLSPLVGVIVIMISVAAGWDELLHRMAVPATAFSLLLPPLYIAGRAATLLIAFTALRSLPDAALIDVDWTTFIPHI